MKMKNKWFKVIADYTCRLHDDFLATCGGSMVRTMASMAASRCFDRISTSDAAASSEPFQERYRRIIGSSSRRRRQYNKQQGDYLPAQQNGNN